MSFTAVDPAFLAGVELEKEKLRNRKRLILVTGGSSGIGKSICEYLAQKGHKVISASRSIKTGEQIQENIIGLSLDVTNLNSIQKAVEWLSENKLDISVLINNAGTGLNGALEEVTDEQIRKLFDLNFFGLHNLTTSLLPTLRAKKDAYIINISSIAGQIGLPYRGVYSASKFAVEGYSESLRMEVMPFNVKVVLVEPGDFKTNINQNRQVAQTKENSPYFHNFKRIDDKINVEVGEADDPLKVAITIEKIIGTNNPKFRYKVAKPLQKLSVWLSRALPFRWFQRILMKFYGL
jgi:short-subunit dehydrogenase